MDIASVYQFWKNPVILVRIQLEWFIPVDILLLSIKREKKGHRYYFLNGTTQSHSCFLCEKKKYQYHMWERFHPEFPHK